MAAGMEPEQSGNPALAPYVKAGRLMGNTEGKEVRFKVGCSVLTAVTTSNLLDCLRSS
jgi:K+-transporting ATPase A subunit